MSNSIPIGKIKGIQIEINYSWFIVFALVTSMLALSFFPANYPGWSTGLKWGLGALMAIMLFVSVLLHELSHSIVSISQGIDVKKISLFIFGGVAQMEKEPDEAEKELKIAVAGPAMSLFLFLVFLGLAILAASLGAGEVVIVPLTYISNVNLVLAIFNMVPAFPLDGGRVLRAAIWKYKGNLQMATRIASSAGGTFGYFMIVLGAFWIFTGNIVGGIWFIFIGWFISQSSQNSYQHMLMTDTFGKIRVKEFMSEHVEVVKYHLTVSELVDHYFYRYKYSCFPVEKQGEIIGITNVESVKSIEKEYWDNRTVESATIKLRANMVVSPDDTVNEAMNKVFSNEVGRVLVMDADKLLGIVSRTDILNHIRIYNQLN